ncbi:MAG: CDP-glycerol glycerophosphotransferase family protein [Patescibacteria group bacterium]
MRLLIAVDAPGPAEFIRPVIGLLKSNHRYSGASKRHEIKIVTVKDSPTKILAKFRPTRCDSEKEAEKIYKKFRPDALIIAMSSLVLGPHVNLKFSELANKGKKTVIGFQDFWANHRWPTNRKILSVSKAILVPDDLAENLILQDGYKGKVLITGSPAFDKFREIYVPKERKRLRKKLGIPEDFFVILHAGTGTPQSWKEDETTFKFIANTIKELQKEAHRIAFISRPHPRDENPERYKKLAPDLKMIETKSIPITEELVPVSDVVIGMYSTNLVHAAYLRIPAISILLPNGGMRRLKKIHLADFPPNAAGATVGIYKASVPALKKELELIMIDPIHNAVIKKAQERFFPILKETAAKKVLGSILSLIN